jgi:hypothetical protein
MKRLMDLIGMAAGGWLGWYIGAVFGVFTAFILSVIGTGAGLYATRRWLGGLLP